NAALALAQPPCLRMLSYVRLGIEVLEDAVNRGQRVAQYHAQIGQALQRRIEHPEIEQKLRKRTDGELSVQYLIYAIPYDQYRRCMHDETDRHFIHRRE